MSTINLHNKTFIDKWIESNVLYVQQNYLDGINVDFEDEIDSDDKLSSHALNEAIEKLKRELQLFVPGAQLTFDVGWLPNVDKRYYDYRKLSEINDFLVVMDYDEQSAIYGACKAGPTSSFPNLIKGMSAFKSLKIPFQKLVAALPWYGHDFTCINQINSTVCPIQLAPWRGVQCTDANAPEYSYSDIITKFLPKSTTGILWDQASSSPYFDYTDDQANKHQMWFDNAKSNNLKVQWAKLANLRGVGVFTVDLIDYNNETQKDEMWGALNSFFQ